MRCKLCGNTPCRNTHSNNNNVAGFNKPLKQIRHIPFQVRKKTTPSGPKPMPVYCLIEGKVGITFATTADAAKHFKLKPNTLVGRIKGRTITDGYILSRQKFINEIKTQLI